MYCRVSLTLAILLFLSAGVTATPIHEAVATGDVERVRSLIEGDPSLVSAPDSAHSLPLHLAASAGNVELIEYLIAHGAEVDAGDRENTRALGCAAMRGHYDAALALVNHGASLDRPDDFGSTPIVHAFQGGNVALVRRLIELGAPLEVPPTARTPLLHAAVIGGNPELVGICLDHGVDINARDARNFTALHWAAFRNRTEMIRLLKDRGADLEILGGQTGLTPLTCATYTGAVDAARTLIDLGANLQHRNEHGQTLLHLAAERGHVAISELFVDRGIEINAVEHFGGTALNYAVRGHTDMVRWLLDHGANPNAASDTSTSPLYFAVDAGDTVIASMLIAAGADPNAADEDGSYPLHLATRGRHADAVSLLLRAGADPDKAEAETAQTALHTAALSGRSDILGAMLEQGAAIDVKDADGHTPIYYAARYGHRRCVDLLKQKGASTDGIVESYGTPSEVASVPPEGQAVVWYLGHSGWAIRTTNHFLVFDYQEEAGVPDQRGLRCGYIDPAEIAALPVTVFSTHEHHDHYDTVIFDWRNGVKTVSYVLGHQPADRTGYAFIPPRQSQSIDGIQVSTIHSTDAGVGYVVEVDGLTIFMAGDHASGSVDLPDDYTAEINYIAERWPAVDMAFMPITGCSLGTPESVQAGYIYSLGKLHPRMSFPEHSGAQEKRYANFKTDAREKGVDDSIVCAEHRGDMFVYNRDKSI